MTEHVSFVVQKYNENNPSVQSTRFQEETFSRQRDCWSETSFGDNRFSAGKCIDAKQTQQIHVE